MADPKTRIGSEIKRLRGVIGLTQDALAARSGISKSSIGLLERGLVWPQYENLEALAATLNVEVEDLLGGGLAPRPQPITAREALETLIAALEDAEPYLSASAERRMGYRVIDSFTPVELKVFLREHGSLFEAD